MLFRSFVLIAAVTAAAPVMGQPLGTFQWQLQPFCNILHITATQQGAVYTLDGYDDQCGAERRAPLVGVATPNPDGTLELGLHIVTAPSARPLVVAATIATGTGNGTWTDSAGNQGAFALGASAAGAARPPAPVAVIPAAISLNSDGGLESRNGLGARLSWQPAIGAFRAGLVDNDQWADYRIGQYSMATGFNTVASGQASVAMGYATGATGRYSVAMGVASQASGEASVAMGASAANGPYAHSAGFATNANGVASMALGHISTANGDISVVLGRRAVTTQAASGSFVFGDNSGGTDVVSAAANQFLVRAAGGVTFYSSPDTVSGPNVTLMPGASAWSTLSDVNTKEHFVDLQNEEVLRRIAAMPVRAWSFKAQDSAIHHIGPTAQDFHAAFGLGEDPRRINSLDADGVALAGVRALEVRTRTDGEQRYAGNAALRAELAALQERLSRLEALLRR